MHLLALVIVLAIVYVLYAGWGGEKKGGDRYREATAMVDRIAGDPEIQPPKAKGGDKIVIARPDDPRAKMSQQDRQPGSLRAPIEKTRSVLDQVRRSREEE